MQPRKPSPPLPTPRLNLSGERFTVLYSIAAASEQEAQERAFSVAVEQTVEFPYELVPSTIQEQIVGRVAGLEPAGPGRWLARISYAVETTGFELTQLLNVMMGNSSIFPGVRVERFDLPGMLLGRFRGPRYGVQGLRTYLGVPERPLRLQQGRVRLHRRAKQSAHGPLEARLPRSGRGHDGQSGSGNVRGLRPRCDFPDRRRALPRRP